MSLTFKHKNTANNEMCDTAEAEALSDIVDTANRYLLFSCVDRFDWQPGMPATGETSADAGQSLGLLTVNYLTFDFAGNQRQRHSFSCLFRVFERENNGYKVVNDSGEQLWTFSDDAELTSGAERYFDETISAQN